MKGTIIIFVAVRKALFDGVVYSSPTVWAKKPKKSKSPAIMPYLYSCGEKFLSFLGNKHSKSTEAIINLKHIMNVLLSPLSIAIRVTINTVPQITEAINNKPVAIVSFEVVSFSILNLIYNSLYITMVNN